jgi:site-specific recombinase XerC
MRRPRWYTAPEQTFPWQPHADFGADRRRQQSTGVMSEVLVRPHISTRQYARLVHRWVASIGLEAASYGTHSMRRTEAAQIYRKTGNLRAVQLLLGHTKLESTVRYLGI